MVVTNLLAQGKARRIRIVTYSSKGKREYSLSDMEHAPGANIIINDWQIVYKSGVPAKATPPKRPTPRRTPRTHR